jgi:hypothetical protein
MTEILRKMVRKCFRRNQRSVEFVAFLTSDLSPLIWFRLVRVRIIPISGVSNIPGIGAVL